MPVKRFPPDDPREWLNRARSNLAKADVSADRPEIYLEDLCFDAQQAAEKAIKFIAVGRQSTRCGGCTTARLNRGPGDGHD